MLSTTHKRSKRKTRIIATLGPATNDRETILKLFEAGVNIIRLNMSHSSHQEHRRCFELVRKAAAKMKVQVAIICDLCGPKIRVGLLKDGEMLLKARSIVTVTTRNRPAADSIPCQYASLHKDVQVGNRILLDDGKMELKVLEINGRDISCRVVFGGLLKDKKGINLPDSQVSSSSLTPNDKKDVLFAMEMGADFIALSFVRAAQDILQLKRFMKRHGQVLPVIAKIEKPEALTNYDEIMRESYAIMVARGDLGIEIDAAQVPIVQRELINRARSACRPVIVATQMMESMILESRPTRAEVGDVSNAAMNGADAVMLSGETSVGKHPVQAVRYMDHILHEMERWQRKHPNNLQSVDMKETNSPRRALAHAAVTIAHDLDLLGLFVPTSSGSTAGVVAAFRPSAPIVGICRDNQVARILMLHWGVIPLVMSEENSRNWQVMSRSIARKFNIKLVGQSIAVLSGFGTHADDDQPVLKILRF